MKKSNRTKFLTGGMAAALVASAIVPTAFASETINFGEQTVSNEVTFSVAAETKSEPSERVKNVIDSLTVQLEKVNNGFYFTLNGDRGDLADVDTVTIKKDGVYVTSRNEEVRIALINQDVVDTLDNPRAIRMENNKPSAVMHHAKTGEITLTTKSLKNILITSKVSEPFIDVTEKDWFQKDVEDAYNYVFAQGTTATTFDPNAKITRGQFAVMVARALEVGQHNVHTNYSFDDMKGKWYAKEAQFLVDFGIIGGYGNGKFGGDDTLTREQAMAILGRTLEFMGVDATSSKAANVTDLSKVSAYAKDYVNYFAEQEVLASGSKIAFNPKDSLTRAQMAKILVRGLQLTYEY